MKTIDFIDVLTALENGPMNQTALTEAVWGTSGRNSETLVYLLTYMTNRGQITRTVKGRSKIYALPQQPLTASKRAENKFFMGHA